MAQDPQYKAQVLQMEAEFATASWEAWEIGEQSSENWVETPFSLGRSEMRK